SSERPGNTPRRTAAGEAGAFHRETLGCFDALHLHALWMDVPGEAAPGVREEVEEDGGWEDRSSRDARAQHGRFLSRHRRPPAAAAPRYGSRTSCPFTRTPGIP